MTTNATRVPEQSKPRITEPDKARGHWGSNTEFVLSCIGYAVGIGNVWRFPYLCYRSGGGAFLIPYLLMLFLCGIPLFFLEAVLGQFSGIGCMGVFRLSPLFRGVGCAIAIVNVICICYYSVLITYPIRFLQTIFTATLPWVSCNNAWNTKQCVEVDDINVHNFTSQSLKTPADEFFHLEILKMSSGIEDLGGIVWPLFWSLCICWVIICLCIIKGIHSVGKVVYFTATFPYVILLVLFIRGVTLPGAIDGIVFYIKPEWSRLLDMKVWADAALQIFISLGPGWGGIINMASFNKFRHQLMVETIMIPIINCATSIFAGFVVFSVLGFLSHKSGVPVASVATSGPGLAFVTYPQAVAMLPFPQIWAGMFFFMLFLLGLDSVFVQIEAFVFTLLDEFPVLRSKKMYITILSCFVFFLASIIMVSRGGMFVLQLFDWYSSSISVILICFVEVVMVAWVYGVDNFMNDIFFMTGKMPNFIWKYCWAVITPILLLMMFLNSILFIRRVRYSDIYYPDWSIAIGWLSCALSISCIPLYMIYVLFRSDKPFCDNLKEQLRAVKWHPAAEQDRIDYEQFKLSLSSVRQKKQNVQI